jgi:hypothetical protein
MEKHIKNNELKTVNVKSSSIDLPRLSVCSELKECLDRDIRNSVRDSLEKKTQDSSIEDGGGSGGNEKYDNLLFSYLFDFKEEEPRCSYHEWCFRTVIDYTEVYKTEFYSPLRIEEKPGGKVYILYEM